MDKYVSVAIVAIHNCWLELRRRPGESQEVPHGRLVDVDGGVRVVQSILVSVKSFSSLKKMRKITLSLSFPTNFYIHDLRRVQLAWKTVHTFLQMQQ